MANICVFCSAKEDIPEIYKKAAHELGKLIGQREHNLVYGGTDKGLMGVVARATQENGGKAIGILPRIWEHLSGIEDELIAADDLRHRKTLYELKSDAFISLPGGIGTIDETADTLVCQQIGIHDRPLAIINTNRFYDSLIQQFELAYIEGFIGIEQKEKYKFVSTPQEALDYVESRH